MLLSKNRASAKIVDAVFKHGRSIKTQSLNFKFIENRNSNIPTVSFLVPKSLSKSAAARGNLRRRGYRIIKKFFSSLPKGISGVFIFKDSIVSPSQLEQEIKFILSKL